MKTGLWIVDVQENIFPLMDRSTAMLKALCFILEAANPLHLPILITEQYPKGLGPTIAEILERLDEPVNIWEKTTFSGYADADVKMAADSLADNWILVGLEAHICVLQTAKDLRKAGKSVVVCQDAIRSRSHDHYQCAIDEMRQMGVRISSTQTLVYEAIHDAASETFKRLLPVIKRYV
jgi:hypothetical protein